VENQTEAKLRLVKNSEKFIWASACAFFPGIPSDPFSIYILRFVRNKINKISACIPQASGTNLLSSFLLEKYY